MRSVARVGAVVSLGVLMSACSASGTRTDAAPPDAAVTTTTTAPAASTTTTVAVRPGAIYDPNRDARADIAAALDRAEDRGTRVLIDFGADWCPPCHVVDKRFHEPDVAAQLDAGFEVVKVDVGDWDRNMDLFYDDYGDYTRNAIPAIVILDPSGDVVGSTADHDDLDEMSDAAFRETLTAWAG